MKPDINEIRSGIIEVLEEMVEDWDLDEEITSETRLAEDLCFSSVDVLNLMAAIDVRFGRRLPYEDLVMEDGQYRTELTVAEIARFVDEHYEQDTPGEPVPM